MASKPLPIAIVGEALFGPDWPTHLARALGYAPKTGQRWARLREDGTPERAPSRDDWNRIWKLAENHMGRVRDASVIAFKQAQFTEKPFHRRKKA